MTANTYTQLQPAAIRPTGWLRTQLLIEAKGLSGNLDRIWKDVRDSKWIGGTCDGWERVPYWLDGFIPLAYLLRDDAMIARAQRYVHAILDGQYEDGWLCPCTKEERAGYDMWALLLISKVLVLYADCEPVEAPRVEQALLRAFSQAKEHLAEHPLFGWGQYRWFEGLIAVYWLYDRTKAEWLLAFADLLHAQGKDFPALIDRDFDAYRIPERKWQWDTHVVNLAMAIKSEGLWQKRCGTHASACGTFPRHMYETLMQYHGMANGHFTGDECLSGRSPIQGTELCGVVEAMYSYEVLLALTGDPYWGDLLERVAFNALPATISPDMWTHQYDQQINQIACATESELSVYGSNGREAGVFGLEPNFGCCTANMPQGWPKLALSVFLKNDDAVFSALPLPTAVDVIIKDIPVQIECCSAYPFKGQISYRVTAETPVEFSLDIRIPGTAKTASVDGKDVAPGTVVSVRRMWEGTSEVSVILSFSVTLDDAGYENLRCVNYGPLLFSLPINALTVQKEYTVNGVERRYPYCDYLLYPTSDWQFAFACSADAMIVSEYALPGDDAPVFSPNTPALTIEAELVPIDWRKKEGFAWTANDVPCSTSPMGPAQRKTLIPYGCTMLRMTAMPKI